MTQAINHLPGRKVFLYFAAFFLVVAALDGLFVYLAVSTQSGVVVDQAYEKGLAYNEVLDKARARPQIDQKAAYENGVLRWRLTGESGAITDAKVTAKILRPVQDGFDFDITLDHKGGGIYEARPDLPMKGLWIAKLSGTWNSEQYQTTHKFIVE